MEETREAEWGAWILGSEVIYSVALYNCVF